MLCQVSCSSRIFRALHSILSRLPSGVLFKTRFRIPMEFSALFCSSAHEISTKFRGSPPRQKGLAGNPTGKPLYVSTLLRYSFRLATLIFFDTALDHNPRHKEIRKRKGKEPK